MDPEYAEPSLRVIDRLCRNKVMRRGSMPVYASLIDIVFCGAAVQAFADEVRQLDGLTVVSTVLESYKGREGIDRLGTKVMTRLAASSVKELVQLLTTASAEKEKEFFASVRQ